MKTKLPSQIKTVEEAKAFLTELLKNRESYDPADDALDVNWCMPEIERPTVQECEQLNKLMDDIKSVANFDARIFLREIIEKDSELFKEEEL